VNYILGLCPVVPVGVLALFMLSNVIGYRRGGAGLFTRKIGGAGWDPDTYGMDAHKWVGSRAWRNDEPK
jgi:hypothetical protein